MAGIYLKSFQGLLLSFADTSNDRYIKLGSKKIRASDRFFQHRVNLRVFSIKPVVFQMKAGVFKKLSYLGLI
jgi:hypothetical protein